MGLRSRRITSDWAPDSKHNHNHRDIPANFFWVKRVRFLSCQDRDLWKCSSHFRRFLTILPRLLNIAENVRRYSDDVWTLTIQTDCRHLKAFAIVIKSKEMIHNKSEMKWSFFLEQLIQICKSGVRNCPWCVRSMSFIRRRETHE